MGYLRQDFHPNNEFGDCIVQPALTVSTTENTDENKLVRRRKRFPLSFILGGIAILAAVIYLISANTQANAVYYMTVNELRSCTTCTAQSVRVAGVIQACSGFFGDHKEHIIFFFSPGSGEDLLVTHIQLVSGIFFLSILIVF